MLALLLLPFRCLATVNVLWLFLTFAWVGLQCVIMVFLYHTHLLLYSVSVLSQCIYVSFRVKLFIVLVTQGDTLNVQVHYAYVFRSLNGRIFYMLSYQFRIASPHSVHRKHTQVCLGCTYIMMLSVFLLIRV